MARFPRLEVLHILVQSLLIALLVSFSVAGGASATESCSGLTNSAFVFIKPHANTAETQALVKDKLTNAGIDIISELDITAEDIDKKKLIDKHYYAIASKATMLSPKDFPVPADLFQESFGETWQNVLDDKRAANALEACKIFDCTPDELNAAWRQAEQEKKVVKFGGGFYCGLLSVNEKPALYVFNAFFMSMRAKFVQPGTSIHCYEIEWQPSALSWSSFRSDIVGPTDPESAPKGSLRRIILERYEDLGLESQPTKGENGVHASASPLEGLAEKMNWLQRKVEKDAFGKALLDSGIGKKIISDWSLDPQVKLPDGSSGSVFDYLEDLDADECLEKMVQLHQVKTAK